MIIEEFETAIEWYTKGLDLYRKVYGEDENIEVAEYYKLIGEQCLSCG